MESPPPGWYDDGPDLRWWDGRAWGPTAQKTPPPTDLPPPPPPPTPPPPAGPDESDRVVAVLAHAGAITGGFILPLVLYIIARDRKDSLARHHAAEALNFQLTFMVVAFGAVAVGLIATFTQLSADPEAVPWGIFLIWPVMMIATAANIVFSIIGMVRASSLERWRYPINIRLIGRG